MSEKLILKVVQFLVGTLGDSEDSCCKEHDRKHYRIEQQNSDCDAG